MYLEDSREYYLSDIKIRADHVWKEYVNDFTRECDEHFYPSWKMMKENGHETYILLDNVRLKDKTLAFRCPGCTIGHIKYDDSSGKKIITEVKIYTPYYKSFYNDSINDIVTSKKWIGKELILEEEH